MICYQIAITYINCDFSVQTFLGLLYVHPKAFFKKIRMEKVYWDHWHW